MDTTTLRMTTTTFHCLEQSLSSENTSQEQFAFGVCSIARGRQTKIYLLTELLLPEKGDLAFQGAAGVGPSRSYQTAAYGLALLQRRSVVDMHTHPFQNVPRFSCIDECESKKSAQFIQKCFPPQSTMLMLVFNAGISCFQGRVLDRNTGTFKEIEVIEVLGKEIRYIPRDPTPRLESDEKFARHLLVPGWDQPKLGKLKVFLAGLGGNGAVIFSGLLSLGVGTGSGWIVACDPDRIEASNLPRIAYAKPSDIGKQKARVSASFARTKEPKARGYCFSCGAEDTRVLPWIKESHLLIGALDRDAPRSYLNQLSARYLIPFLDVAAEIIPGKGGCQAAGQIRLVEPGATACLVCSGSLDYSRVDPQRLSSEDLEKERLVGYIRGLDESPTPAVLDVNGVTGNLALSHFRRMVFGEPLDGREYVFYDRQQGRIVSAHLPKPNPDCPVCGRMGEIGRGDIEEETIDSGNDTRAPFRVVKGKVSREARVEEHTEKKTEERQTRETGEESSKDGHEIPREASDTSISTLGHGG